MASCPYCAQPLPDPPGRFCPNCGREIAAEVSPPPPPPLAASTPAPPGGPAGATGGFPPWEQPGAGLSALVDTTRQVLTAPADFFRAMPVAAGLGRPLLYGVILGTIGLVATTVYRAVFWATLGPSLAMLGRRGQTFPWLLPYMQTGVGLVVQLILGPPFIVVGLFIAAGIVHLLLMLVGGAQRGFEATFRVLCYCEATALLSVIPLCGNLIQTIWVLVLAIIGLSEAHRVSRGTAALAILLPFAILCCCCAAGAMLALGGGLAAALRRSM